MELTPEQREGFAQRSAERSERIVSQYLPAEAMSLLLESGEATLLGNFDTAPVRYLQRWWRPTEEGWEPLDSGAGPQLDGDAERWACAERAVAKALAGRR